jgi:hypothetical protein
VADNKNYPREMGHTTRKGAEICLLGVRGKFGRDRKDVSQVLFAPRADHSEKPVEQYALIERLMGGGPRLSLKSTSTPSPSRQMRSAPSMTRKCHFDTIRGAARCEAPGPAPDHFREGTSIMAESENTPALPS